MNILITGGAGYIGSITATTLIKQGHKVTILDSLEKGHQSTLDKIRQIAGQFEFIKVDLKDRELLEENLKEKNFDAVIHFAAYIEVGLSVKEPERFMENNFGGSKNLFEVLILNNVKKLIFSSTAAVYGMPKSVPIPETAELKPINPYGKSKVKVEKLLDKLSKKEGFDSIRLRYFNPAGSFEGILGEEHEPETHLIPLIFKTAKKEREKLFIFGDDYNTKDGTAIRDYIHILDLVNAHIVALEYLMENEGTDVFNVGTGTGYSVKEVFETTKEVTGLDIPYEITERRKGDAEKLVADPAKINAVMDWKARYNLYDLIKSAWDFERQR